MLTKATIESASGPQALVSLPAPSLTLSLPAHTITHRVHAEVGRYRLRLAESIEDRIAACRLRFRVFNIELGEGLASSYQTGLDTDQFDEFCEHLIVEDQQEDNPVRRIVGTYRMGTSNSNSVVNREQRSWDHPNLFLVGSGVFPTVATANPTLTIAALSLWAADTILKTDLK